jgi:hypothetical protein
VRAGFCFLSQGTEWRVVSELGIHSRVLTRDTSPSCQYASRVVPQQEQHLQRRGYRGLVHMESHRSAAMRRLQGFVLHEFVREVCVAVVAVSSQLSKDNDLSS